MEGRSRKKKNKNKKIWGKKLHKMQRLVKKIKKTKKQKIWGLKKSGSFDNGYRCSTRGRTGRAMDKGGSGENGAEREDIEFRNEKNKIKKKDWFGIW